MIGFGATTGMENDKAGIRDPQICPQGHCAHPSWHQASGGSLSSGHHFKPQKVRSSLKGSPVLPLCPGKPCTTTFPDLFSYVDYDSIIFYKVQSFCSGCWWPTFILTLSCWSFCSPCRAVLGWPHLSGSTHCFFGLGLHSFSSTGLFYLTL